MFRVPAAESDRLNLSGKIDPGDSRPIHWLDMGSDHDQLTLAIETSNPSSSASEWPAVALGHRSGSETVVLASAPLRPRDRHDDALMPAIDEVCRAAGIGPGDLTRIAVSVGPGGFTALRIAVTTAKMLALSRNCDCIAVPTAAALVRNLDAVHFDRGTLAVALGWKRDSVWIERYASPRQRLSAGLERLDRLDFTDCATLIADDRFVSTLDTRLCHGSLAIELPRFDAAGVLAASFDVGVTDPVSLSPLYPREPEAVTKWRELHG